MEKRWMIRTVWKGSLVVVALAVVMALAYLAASFMADSVRLPEELKKPPLALPPLAGSPTTRIKSLGNPEDFKTLRTYQDYLRLQLARNPRLQSVSLYLQLLQRYKDHAIDNMIRTHFLKDRKYHFETISPEQAGWLLQEAATLALLHRFCRAEALPTRTIEEKQSAMIHQGLTYTDDTLGFGFILNSINMLLFQARWRVQDRDFGGALDSLQDVILLAGHYMNCRDGIGLSLIKDTFDPVITMAHDWVGRPEFPLAELNDLSARMEDLERKYLTSEWAGGVLKEFYLLIRQGIVSEMEKPTWRNDVYGWFWKNAHTGKYDYPVLNMSFGKGMSWHILRIDTIGGRSLVAIHNRLHSVEALKEFDKQYLDALERAKAPYSDLHEYLFQEGDGVYRVKEFLVGGMGGNTPSDRLEFVLWPSFNIDTQFHLFRAALLVRQDPVKALAAREENFKGNPHHPWCDPFTEKSFQVNSPTSPTLIWSLGPDLKDQQGLLAYDPTNGTRSAGDIGIPVAR